MKNKIQQYFIYANKKIYCVYGYAVWNFIALMLVDPVNCVCVHYWCMYDSPLLKTVCCYYKENFVLVYLFLSIFKMLQTFFQSSKLSPWLWQSTRVASVHRVFEVKAGGLCLWPQGIKKASCPNCLLDARSVGVERKNRDIAVLFPCFERNSNRV